MTNIDDLLPSNDSGKINKTDKTIGILGWVILLIGFIVFIFESWSLQNTINNNKYWLIGTSIGVVIFAGIMIFFKIKYPSVFVEKARRNSVLWCYFAGPIILVLGTMGFIDTTFANSQIECKDFIITEKNIGNADRYGITHDYWIHCTNNGEEVVLQIGKPSWDKLKENGTVKLYLKKGYFGSEYVTSFQLPNQ